MPEKGYNILFNFIHKYLLKKKIKVILNFKIIPEWIDNKLILKGKKKIEQDYIIWTANPVALISRYFKTKKLDSHSFIVKQLDFNLDKKNLKNNYIQVFSKKSHITRIHIYKIKQQQKISVECLNFDNSKTNLIIEDIKKILVSFKIKCDNNFKLVGISKYLRFDLCTINDFILINKFRKETGNSNLVSSSWETYGREKKIDTMIKTLKEKKII